MKDLTKIPHGELTPEEQKEFERRAHIVDDNDNPPIMNRRIEKPEKDNRKQFNTSIAPAVLFFYNGKKSTYRKTKEVREMTTASTERSYWKTNKDWYEYNDGMEL